MVAGEAEAVIVGVVVTDKVTATEAEQPAPLFPVTVYVVVTPGETTIEDVNEPPGIHV